MNKEDNKSRDVVISKKQYVEYHMLRNLYKGLGGELPVNDKSIEAFISKQRVTL